MLARNKFRKYKLAAVFFILLSVTIIFLNCLPKPLFNTPVSTVLLDKKGVLLGAYIAHDGQWRFPDNKIVTEKFSKAIVRFEDKRFYHHPGVDVIAVCRSAWDDLRSGKIKSGGSTLSMQVIRLSRKGKPRTIIEKIIEMFMALRLECSYSKNEILAMYASNAPFGSNVVGLDAASWRYFGKGQSQLSWAEAAALAVLPNSPSNVRPGKNSERLLIKRDFLLKNLFRSSVIDSVTYILAKSEPLPERPFPLPQLAPHLLTRIFNEQLNDKKNRPAVIHSTIDRDLQIRVNDIVNRHHEELKGNGINNAAALIADVETGNVLAYVGNISRTDNNDEFNSDVDVITSPRSTGSILKPFLFSAMLSEGDLLPGTLIPDIPTQIAGYSPQNFNKDYDGAVPAKRALERSLNVPAVRMLKTFGYDKFNYELKKLGMTTLDQPADHYGLSIILGGAEGNMWDIAGMYASMARTLNHYGNNSGRYDRSDIHPLNYFSIENKQKVSEIMNMDASGVLSASSIWCTFNAMEEVNRPDMENNWREFSSSQRIAWKTGTSFGFRDGWAVGCTPKYVVIVWAGNADGEGRPGLTGISTAAPIMFDIFKLLRPSSWFDQPYDDMQKIAVCKKSGYRASDICEETDSVWIPISGLRTTSCPYHQVVHLDATGKWRVTGDCESTTNMIHRSWFVLPPAQEWFYRSKNNQYAMLPPFRKDCNGATKTASMEFIYPKRSTQIYVPVEIDGKTGKTIFEVASRNANSVIYWNLDDEYIGSTKQFHQFALSPPPGKHLITLVDEHGERLEQYFEILKRD